MRRTAALHAVKATDALRQVLAELPHGFAFSEDAPAFYPAHAEQVNALADQLSFLLSQQPVDCGTREPWCDPNEALFSNMWEPNVPSHVVESMWEVSARSLDDPEVMPIVQSDALSAGGQPVAGTDLASQWQMGAEHWSEQSDQPNQFSEQELDDSEAKSSAESDAMSAVGQSGTGTEPDLHDQASQQRMSSDAWTQQDHRPTEHLQPAMDDSEATSSAQSGLSADGQSGSVTHPELVDQTSQEQQTSVDQLLEQDVQSRRSLELVQVGPQAMSSLQLDAVPVEGSSPDWASVDVQQLKDDNQPEGHDVQNREMQVDACPAPASELEKQLSTFRGSAPNLQFGSDCSGCAFLAMKELHVLRCVGRRHWELVQSWMPCSANDDLRIPSATQPKVQVIHCSLCEQSPDVVGELVDFDGLALCQSCSDHMGLQPVVPSKPQDPLEQRLTEVLASHPGIGYRAVYAQLKREVDFQTVPLKRVQTLLHEMKGKYGT